ncbi:MAG: flavodoxin domain-containing protein [Gaiellaceae bacterium]
MSRTLVTYASKHGSTAEVAVRIAQRLEEAGYDVELLPASRAQSIDGFDCVVLGGALYMGRLHPDARRFVQRHASELTVATVAVFALGPRTLAVEDVAASRKQLDRDLARLPDVAPSLVAVFGGAVDPAKFHWPFSHMAASDARDWQAIDLWADEVAALARPLPNQARVSV